jgi:hypothetical protein
VIWISSGWGTFDTLPALFTVLALYFLSEKKFAFAGGSLAAAIAMKYYAIVLIIPLLILAWKSQGIKGAYKVFASVGLSILVLFLPAAKGVISGFSHVTSATASSAIHYSGLSFWTAITLFHSNFNQTAISSTLIVIALAISYFWMWKKRSFGNELWYSAIVFMLPMISLLLFYSLVGENFFIWILPFVSILSLKGNWIKRLYWILSLIVLITSMTNSLLPYYMLPVSPWIGGWLVNILHGVSPYRIAPTGEVAQGVSIGKSVLVTLGISASAMLIMLYYKSTSAVKTQVSDNKRIMSLD